jgi:hypothetical protein
MKKTITSPDGSIEVVEGTAEEIAAYEKAKKHDTANESPAPKSKRKILLTEEQKEQFRQLMREEVSKQPVRYEFHSHCIGCSKCQPINPYPWYTQPIWIGTPDPLIPYVGDPLPGSYTTSKIDFTGQTLPLVADAGCLMSKVESSSELSIGQQLSALGATFGCRA